MIRDILVSLLLTVVVSVVIASASYLIYDTDILRVAGAAFLIQIIGFYLWNTLLQVLIKNKLEQEQTERIKVYEKQGVTANCAYCDKSNYVPIRMDESNSFDCEHCGKTNSLYIDITVAQKTDILDRDILSINSHIKEKIDAAEKIK